MLLPTNDKESLSYKTRYHAEFNTCRKWSIWFKLPTAGLFPLESGRRASPGYFSLENASGRAGHPQGFFP